MALPFGLTSVAATYQDALRGKFADQVGDVHPLNDQITDQPQPAVNMLHIGRRPGASLQTILEENPDSESQGSTETVAETTTELLPLPPSTAAQSSTSASTTPLGMAKPRRNALLTRTGTSTVRSAEQTRLPL